MRQGPVLAFLVSLLLLMPGPGSLRGENDARIEPVGGILWNDRVEDVRRKLAAFPEILRLEISVRFHDTVTRDGFGPRDVASGSGDELAAAVSSLAREYLAGVDADRTKGRGSLAKAFDLHCAAVLADKDGAPKDYLNVTLRVSAKPLRIEGLPFEMTAEFQAHPGAGLAGRYSLPVQGTKYVLPVVLTKVTLAPCSPATERKFPEIAAELKKGFARFRACTVGTSEGWCDDRRISVSFIAGAAGPRAIRYDAETFWLRGLDAMYKDHRNTLEGGKSCRCHSAPSRSGGDRMSIL